MSDNASVRRVDWPRSGPKSRARDRHRTVTVLLCALVASCGPNVSEANYLSFGEFAGQCEASHGRVVRLVDMRTALDSLTVCMDSARVLSKLGTAEP